MRRYALVVAIGCALAPAVPASGAAQDTTRVTTQGVRLDFQDQELSSVITALAEAGHLNVVYSDLPHRSVTLRMARPVAPDEIPGLLRSLAASNGLDVVEDGPLIRIVGRAVTRAQTSPQKEEETEPELRLFVYRLKHARAAKLAQTLQSLFGGASARPQTADQSAPLLSQRLRQQMVPPTNPDSAPSVAVALDTKKAGLPGQLAGAVQIVPDETTNSLLVRAQPPDWQIVQQAIETLDLRPLQVLIEVLIAEVRRTSSLDLGVSGTAGDSTGTNASLSLNGASAGGFIMNIMHLGHTNANAMLSALATEGTVRIVSRPVILAQNNQQAHILIGDERPFIQVFRSLPTDAAVRDQVVQYRDVGTSLTIVPTINTDGYVNLDLTQEVSTATAEEQFGAPVISTREAATQLFVRNDQTVVIGGLIDHQRTESESGVPLLKDIPLLGHLFESTSHQTTENELFLFLTPHIIQTDEDADRMLKQFGQESKVVRPDTMKLKIGPDTIPGGGLH